MRVIKKYFFPLNFILVFVAIIIACPVSAQKKEKFKDADSLITTTEITDTASTGTVTKKTRVYDPRVAAIRSAILPGLGQIYNKKYWKLPIVYGALGICGGVFVYNLTNYRDTRFAYKAKYNASLPGATAADSAQLLKIKPKLQRLSTASLKYYRDEFRRGVDYAVLFTLLAWGLNVVDATVDAHLKAFDVSPDLSFHIRAGRSQLAGTNGISLVLTIGKNINPRPLKLL